MNKLIVVLVCLMIVASSFAATTIKVCPSYGILLSPDLSNIESILGADITKGGIGFGTQVLLGNNALKYGAEIGYLSIFDYSYIFKMFETEMEITASSTAIPILAIGQYNLVKEGKFIPYIQAGLGCAINTAKISTGFISISKSKTVFALMLCPGVSIEINDSMNIDISIKYYNIATEINTSSTLNIGAGIAFKL